MDWCKVGTVLSYLLIFLSSTMLAEVIWVGNRGRARPMGNASYLKKKVISESYHNHKNGPVRNKLMDVGRYTL